MPRLQATTNGSLIALRALDGVVHSELALPCGAEYCHGGELLSYLVSAEAGV